MLCGVQAIDHESARLNCFPAGQARFLLAKLNPSTTHNSDQSFATSGELIYTDDVSLQVLAGARRPGFDRCWPILDTS